MINAVASSAVWDALVIVGPTLQSGQSALGDASGSIQLTAVQHSTVPLRLEHDLPVDAQLLLLGTESPSGEVITAGIGTSQSIIGQVIAQYGPGTFRFQLKVIAGATPILAGAFANLTFLIAEALE